MILDYYCSVRTKTKNKMKKEKLIQISLRLSPELKKELEFDSAKEDRSINSTILNLLKSALKAKK